MRTPRLHIEIFRRGADDAPAVLLSSGLGGSASYWREQVDALCAKGWTVIGYDQRGTGRSPATLPDVYAISDMAADVLGVLDELGIARCHFVGHALGGLVGLQLALDARERIDSLVPINAWPALRASTARCFDARLRLLEHAGVEAYVEAQPIFLYPSAWMEQHVARVEAEVKHAIEGFPGKHNMLTRIGALKAFDVTARLADLDVPTLAVAAMDDVLVPFSASQALADAMPDAALHLMAHGGHACNVTCPDAFNEALIAFIDRAAGCR